MIRVIVEDAPKAELDAMVRITFATVVGSLTVPYAEANRYVQSLRVDGDLVLTDLRVPQDEKVTPP